MERTVSFALSSIASTLSKLAFDACLYTSQNFGFIKLPDAFTTGSSIMPHKKNPDVFELTRGKCNKLQSLPFQINGMVNNLPSGYFRDFQLLKEVFIPAFGELLDCLGMTKAMLSQIEVNTDILSDEKYNLMFSVEVVNQLTLDGTPFRDAYKEVGLSIESGTFQPSKTVKHTHEGSIGNLCNEFILQRRNELSASFHFENIIKAENKLLSKKS